MAIKRKMTLAAPVAMPDGYQSLAAFDLDYIYVHPEHLTVHLRPSGAAPVNIYPEGSMVPNPNYRDPKTRLPVEGQTETIPRVSSKGAVVLGTIATTRLGNLLQAIEDAVKENLELP